MTNFQSAPTAAFLDTVAWLGHVNQKGETLPAGSGVCIHREGREYIATALHVAEACGFDPLVRRNQQWMRMELDCIATDDSADVAVFKNTRGVAPEESGPNLPRYGRSGILFGTVGRAMGFPTTGKPDEDTRYIAEMDGVPVPVCALVCSYSSVSPDLPSSSIAAGYINQGFSGGAILFPTSDNYWSIAGVITHRLGVWSMTTPLSKTSDPSLVSEPSGLIRYANWSVVEALIEGAA